MDDSLTEYFAQATHWERDRSAQLRDTARRAWWVAGASAVTAVTCAAALLALTPLKRVEPFVIRVDNSTGVVDVVPTYAGTATLPQVVTRHLVASYVIQRERYVAALAESDYEQVGAFHTAAMNQQWAAAWARTNPDSPLNRFADGSHVRVQVNSIAYLREGRGAPEVLQVRFTTARQQGAGSVEQLAHFLATLQVSYGPPSPDLRLRSLNPLGFKVLEYRREPEIGGEAPAAGSGAGP